MAASKAADAKDAIALLSEHHRKIEQMFEEFEDLEDPSNKEDHVRKLCNELIIHTTIEEELFYPALRGQVENEDDLDEAFVEHDGAKVLLAELMISGPDHDFYDAKVRVLGEEIRHHIQEEEDTADGIFAQAKESGVDLKEIGRAMQSRKSELQAQIEASGPPMPITRTFVGAELELGAPLEG